jgi:hypothetical protein
MQPKYLLVDEIEHLKPEYQTTLLSLMETGILTQTIPSADRGRIGGHKGSATSQELAEQFGVSSSTLERVRRETRRTTGPTQAQTPMTTISLVKYGRPPRRPAISRQSSSERRLHRGQPT